MKFDSALCSHSFHHCFLSGEHGARDTITESAQKALVFLNGDEWAHVIWGLGGVACVDKVCISIVYYPHGTRVHP